MKVLFITRATLFNDQGGDTIQALETAKHLEKLHIQADVKLTNEIIDYSGYDLIHFFNIIRPAAILKHISKTDKPYVVSTIFVDYSEFETKARTGMARFLFSLFNADQIEYLKAMARWFKNGEAPGSFRYLWWGHKKSVRHVIRHSRALLPNSESEYKRLVAHYAVQHNYYTIPNAINQQLFIRPGENLNRDEQMVICVGRIEGRKNQLNLIRAVKGTAYSLKIIGAGASNQKGYLKLCKEEAGSNVEFINSMPQHDLIHIYSKAKVHVLASWFETTGLSSLEAGVMGCNLVITDKGDTREYFGQDVWYCDPASPESILSAIQAASVAPVNNLLIKRINTLYTWENAAVKTRDAYDQILSDKDT
ncbi:MAG: glycosyltransferase [Bacteroidota bacterium]|nr:glycosyltransferase [Bacteroidota bacterium]MDP4211272.1 glycosyltransferase [Bacteroidota bacterium]MDP4250039.1 glycosyltransferase [Bacteroidota bacterium]